MAVNKVNLPYPDFKLGDVIDPEEFDANNNAIVDTVNALVDATNTYVDEDGEDIFLPTYIKETHIEGAEIRSPLITGNTLIGSTGMVGITSVGTTSDSVRIWAGNSNKNIAPFRVTHDGSVTMTKANIETVSDTTGSFIKMQGSKIEGGKTAKVPYYVIGTAKLNTDSKSGIFRFNTYLTDDDPATTEPDYIMEVVHNSIMVQGGNLVLGGVSYGGNKGVVITKSVLPSQHGMTIPGGAALHVVGSINLTGDIYINGVKMKLTPA